MEDETTRPWLPDTFVTTGSEAAVLGGFLDLHRGIVARKVAGLGEADARRQLVPSGTTLLGLVKHLTSVEREWARIAAGRRPDVPGDTFALAPEDTVPSVIAGYEAACAESRTAAEGRDLDEVVPHDDLGSVSVRWIVVHLIEETARHAGHADILREQIDGSTGFS